MEKEWKCPYGALECDNCGMCDPDYDSIDDSDSMCY